MADAVNAWQCIGCGSIEAPQTCIGICQDDARRALALLRHPGGAERAGSGSAPATAEALRTA